MTLTSGTYNTAVISENEGEVISARTIVVLDTSVLLSDPESIFSFPNCDIVLPIKVIEELDNNKTRPDDVGRAAREVARKLEKLRLESDDKSLNTAVELDNDSSIRFVLNGLKMDTIKAQGLEADKADNQIIGAALGLQGKGQVVKLVSADVALRLKAASLGLEAAEYIQTHGKRVHDEKHPGWKTLNVSEELVAILYDEYWVPLEALEGDDLGQVKELSANEYAVLKSVKSDGSPATALARRTTRDKVIGIELLNRNVRNNAYGLKARSKEQSFALDMLLNPKIPIVGLSGRAGTGKTILAVASALEQVVESSTYDRIMILRPVIPVGNQGIGYLPGTLEEKLGPWMEAITDTMVALSDRLTHTAAKDILDNMVEQGKLTLETVTFLRGRSLQNTFVIVDEAQNLEPLTLKTILTRIGANSKVVLVGDVSQIDNPWSSERSNAISVLADRFAGQELFGHLVLTKGERSEVADLAAGLL